MSPRVGTLKLRFYRSGHGSRYLDLLLLAMQKLHKQADALGACKSRIEDRLKSLERAIQYENRVAVLETLLCAGFRVVNAGYIFLDGDDHLIRHDSRFVIKRNHPVHTRHISEAGHGDFIQINIDKQVTREERFDLPGTRVDRCHLQTRIENTDFPEPQLGIQEIFLIRFAVKNVPGEAHNKCFLSRQIEKLDLLLRINR